MSASGATRSGRALVWLAVAGNVLFVAWVAYNAIDSGFRGTLPEVVSGIGLAALLVLDTVLLLRRSRG
jgi:hypothetical protein